VETLILDEADQMLDLGFIHALRQIAKLVPTERQTLFFSATMPKEIQRLTEAFLNNPKRIEVAPASSAAKTVKQSLLEVDSREKRKVLRHLLRKEPIANGIIFCNRKRDVDMLYRNLKDNGFSVAALHGDMEQRHRLEVLENFKANNVQLLVASDVAARGLDIPSVSHVFNFDVPVNSDDYIHRIGRTGRAGREGHAFMLATDKDDKYLDAIEKMLGSEIPKITVDGPGGKRPQPAAAKGRRPTRAARKVEDDNRNTRGSDGATSVAEKGSRVAEKGSRNQAVTGTAKKDHRQDTPVVGMGDHVPAFMLRPVVRNNKTGSAANNDID
jgi:superfamily II DNA/RNA helicase